MLLFTGILIFGALAIGISFWLVISFFEGVSLRWFWDVPPPAQMSGSEYVYDPSVYPALSPIVSTILEEVKTGWSVDTVLHFWGPMFPLSVFLSLFLSAGIIYCVVRILQIRRAERKAFAAAAHPIASQDLPRSQLRWHRVLEQVNSDDPDKWRLSILEADIMLNDLLDVLGYKGETMSEKMKQVPIEAFNTIDFAWEAHKIRNRLVHDGATFKLDAREAKRVIRMYERVLKEFKYIE